MKKIHKDFYGNEVLHGVDFSLKAGTVHALMGENGGPPFRDFYDSSGTFHRAGNVGS